MDEVPRCDCAVEYVGGCETLTESHAFEPTVFELATVTVAPLVPSPAFFSPTLVQVCHSSIPSPACTEFGIAMVCAAELLNPFDVPARNEPVPTGGGVSP